MPDELDPSTYELLDHVARYRMGVPEAVVRTPPFADVSPRRMRRMLEALCGGEGEPLLAGASLYGERRYFYLTRRGEAAVGGLPPGEGSHRRMGALSEVAKVRAYATLSFCCLAERPRQRLTPEEFRLAFPAHHRPGLPTGYYADHAAGRLGFIRVDSGGGGRWDRVVGRVREDLGRHRTMPAFVESAAAGTFELAVVVPTERKAERLRPLLEEEARASGIPLVVHIVPELIELIAPPPR